MNIKILTIFFLFLSVAVKAQIHFIGEVRDSKGLPVKNLTVVFGNSNQKCLTNSFGVIDCNLSYNGGEEIEIRIEPSNYLLTIDNPIIIKKNYEARSFKIGVVKKGAEKVQGSLVNVTVQANINSLTKTFIENAPDRLPKERVKSKSISDAVIGNLISLDQLAKMKNEAAFAGIAYYIIEKPEIKYFKYIKSSYNLILRNFTRYAYLKALIEMVKGRSFDSLQSLSKDIETIAKVFDEEGDNSVKEKCFELKEYLGLNEGWNEKGKCYRFKDTKIQFKLVNKNCTNGDFMKPYFISEPLKNDIISEFISLNNGAYPHPAKLTPGTLIDSIDWRNYKALVETFKELSIPTFFEIINSDLAGAIVLDSSVAVLSNCEVKMVDGVWPLCFIKKIQKPYDELSKTNYLHRWRKEFELNKNGFNYFGIQVDPTILWIQPEDGSVLGRDFYNGPFFLVKK